MLDNGVNGEVYNVTGTDRLPNRVVTERILALVDKPWSLVRSVPDRPGHDIRYAMDGTKLAQLGWQPTTTFDEGLVRTVEWFRDNAEWWRQAKSGDWGDYYEHQYGWRLAELVEA